MPSLSPMVGNEGDPIEPEMSNKNPTSNLNEPLDIEQHHDLHTDEIGTTFNETELNGTENYKMLPRVET